MPYYDLHVYTSETVGEHNLQEMATAAKRLGLSGIGVVRFPEQEFSPFPKTDVDVVSVALVKVNSADQMHDLIRRVRDKAEIVAVAGGVYDINRAACESPAVDILFHPEKGRTDSGLDHICARAAQENNVAVELNFHQVLEAYKRQRVRELSSMRKNVMLCRRYGTPVIATSGGLTKWDLRAGRDLAALPAMLGMDLGQAIDTTSAVPESMVACNREKLSGKAWEGVKVVKE
jgi:ribonuclease P/MRP protein subunit RPP1